MTGAAQGTGKGVAMAEKRPRSYEDTLGDGLEIVLSKGAKDLAAVARALNEINVAGPKGERWDEALLAAELKRLAPAPGE